MMKVGDRVTNPHGIHTVEGHTKAGSKGSVQIVNGDIAHVLIDGTRENRKLPCAYLEVIK